MIFNCLKTINSEVYSYYYLMMIVQRLLQYQSEPGVLHQQRLLQYESEPGVLHQQRLLQYESDPGVLHQLTQLAKTFVL